MIGSGPNASADRPHATSESPEVFGPIAVISPVHLLAFWGAVSAFLLTVSFFRTMRFHRLLNSNAIQDPQLTAMFSQPACKSLGLQVVPPVYVTPANIAPFVWWSGGRSIVVVPRRGVDQLSPMDLHLIISHELAHIKRRDHWFRWIEWFALITLWWNPVMWLARQQLRVSEEMACDELVLQSQRSGVKPYANSLLNMAELLTEPALRPPALASAINSGGTLENRLKMMIAKNSWRTPTKLRMAILGAAICVFPFGFVYAQDLGAVEKRLAGAVESGELTLDQAQLMMDALKRSLAETERHAEHHEHDFDEHEAREREALEREHAARQRMERMRAEARERELHAHRERAERMERMKAHLMEVEQDLKAAVEAGDLSVGDAKDKLNAIREEAFGEMAKPNDERYRREREMEARKAEWMELERTLHKAVEAGKISEDEAHEKMIAAKKELFGEYQEHSQGMEEREARQARYMEMERMIDNAVETGQLSERDARRKLAQVERELFGEDSHDDHEHGNHEHGNHEHGNHEHGNHEHGDHEHDGHDHADHRHHDHDEHAHDHDEHEHDEHAHGGDDHDHGHHEHADHEHGDYEHARHELEAKRAEMAAIAREIEMAVREGKLSKAEARNKLREINQRMLGDREEHEEYERNMEMESRKARYLEFEQGIQAAVESGKLSEESAEKKLIEIRQKLFDEEAEEGDRVRRELYIEEKEARYEEYKRDAEEAIRSGKVSPEDAERKLHEIRRKMFGGEHADHEERMMEKKKAHYMEIMEEFKAAVEAGKVSRKEAEEQLIEIREKMLHSHDEDDEDHGHALEDREARYLEIVKELEASVDAGELSADEAKRQMDYTKSMMFGRDAEASEEFGPREESDEEEARDSDGEVHAVEEQFEAIVAEVKQAVEAGKIQKDEAEKRLQQLRDRLERFKRSRERYDHSMEERKEIYQQRVREIMEASENGELSKRDAERRVIELRQEIFQRDR